MKYSTFATLLATLRTVTLACDSYRNMASFLAKLRRFSSKNRHFIISTSKYIVLATSVARNQVSDPVKMLNSNTYHFSANRIRRSGQHGRSHGSQSRQSGPSRHRARQRERARRRTASERRRSGNEPRPRCRTI